MISKRESKNLPYVLTVMDMGAVMLAFSTALLLRFNSPILLVSLNPTHIPRYLYLMIGLLPVWWLNLAYFKLYSSQYLLHGNDEYRRVVNAAASATVHTMVVIFLLKADFARGWVLLSWVTATVFLLGGRLLHRRIHRWLISREGGKRSPLILIGANQEAKRLADEIGSLIDLGVQVAGAVAWQGRESTPGLKILGSMDDLPQIIDREQAEAALVVPSALPAAALQGLYHKLSKAGVAVYISPSLFDIVASRAAVLPFSDLPLIRLQEVEFSGIKYAVKRTGDFIGAVFLLAALSPLFLVLSILIKMQSRGPAFFTQERVGRHGRLFKLYKFRTMVTDAEGRQEALLHLNEATGPIFKMRDDPRLTRVGKWLRKHSLDELPQLFNVVGGRMSLVGPRPPIPGEVAAYGDYEKRRLEVAPGMTGLWQIRGRSDTTFDEMVRLDLYYIENWSPPLDFYILLRTVGVVFFGKGAY